ncbi:MAG: hypothetical protein OXC29_18095, partial [Rhodococcus sp.]|nr:hypothetical protein [Rhodococcus sp. (in: high G+C Gram-positive bacteria)]
MLALAAMIGALFAAFPSASAQTPGDVNSTSGVCLVTDVANTYGLFYDSNEDDTIDNTDDQVGVYDAGYDSDDATAGIQPGYRPVSTSLCKVGEDDAAPTRLAGSFSITPNGTQSPTIAYLAPSVVVSAIGEVEAGSSVGVQAYVKNGHQGVTYTWVSSDAETGVSLVGEPTAAPTWTDATIADVEGVGTVIVPPSASGSYTVTVSVSSGTDDAISYLVGEAEISVGDAPAEAVTNLDTASLSLGNATPDDPKTTVSEAVAETGSAPADDDSDTAGIWLKLEVLNSEGEASSNSGLSQVLVSGFGGKLSIHASDAGGNPVAGAFGDDAGTPDTNEGETNHSATLNTAADVKNVMFIKVQKADGKPGKVTVFARVIGSDDSTEVSNSVTLTFTGAAADIEVSDANDRLAQKGDSITFEVTGADTADGAGTVAASQITASLLDADGDPAENLTVSDAQAFNDKNGNGEQDDGENDIDTKVIITVASSATKAADAGRYEMQVLLNGSDKTKQTVAFTVSGPAANIELTASPESATERGELVDLTAKVTDADGTEVPDDTTVTFSVTPGGGVALISDGKDDTKDGVATATLGVSGGGTTFVYAVAGDARGTLTFVSTAGQVEAAQMTVAASVTLAEVEADLSHGDSVTVTAMVADADGNAVPNGTLVTFSLAGGGTLFSPRTVGTIDGNVSADIVNLTDDIWVRAFSGTASSGTQQVSVESESEETARLAQEAEDARIADAEQAAADAADDAAAEADKAATAA